MLRVWNDAVREKAGGTVTLPNLSAPPTWHSQQLSSLWASFLLNISTSSTPVATASGPHLLSEATPRLVPVL